MGGSAIGKGIDAVLKVGLAPLLKEQGWKKQTHTWRKDAADGTWVVNVQSSRWNFGEKGKFTINLGVYFPKVARLLGDPRLETPREVDCQIRVRVGQILPVHRDFWWELDPATDAPDLGVDVAEKMKLHGLPFFERAGRLAPTDEEWPPHVGQTDVAVAMAIAAGDLERARWRAERVLARLPATATIAIRRLERLKKELT